MYIQEILKTKIKNVLKSRELISRRYATLSALEPEEFVTEDTESIFRVKYKKRGKYMVFLENEYLNSQYKTTLIHKSRKSEEPVTEIKKPRPHAVMLHRKKLRKNKLKDSDGKS